jgi:hypothetical protein
MNSHKIAGECVQPMSVASIEGKVFAARMLLVVVILLGLEMYGIAKGAERADRNLAARVVSQR